MIIFLFEFYKQTKKKKKINLFTTHTQFANNKRLVHSLLIVACMTRQITKLLSCHKHWLIITATPLETCSMQKMSHKVTLNEHYLTPTFVSFHQEIDRSKSNKDKRNGKKEENFGKIFETSFI